MGTPKHRSEKGRGVPHSQKQEKSGHLHSSFKTRLLFLLLVWFPMGCGCKRMRWNDMSVTWGASKIDQICFVPPHSGRYTDWGDITSCYQYHWAHQFFLQCASRLHHSLIHSAWKGEIFFDKHAAVSDL